MCRRCSWGAHTRSIIGCCIYVEFAINLLKGQQPQDAYYNMRNVIVGYFNNAEYEEELNKFEKVIYDDIWCYGEEEIHSSGHVVSTLEAALWCFFTSNSYKEVVLCAVNLGGDTDTIAAIAGGIAGIYYGVESIPSEWIELLPKKEEIFDLTMRLDQAVKNIQRF